MGSSRIEAQGFNHWILGSADMAEPLAMPTHLPYAFAPPDAHGRVPFPDVALASTYKWALQPENNYPFHTFSDTVPHLSDEAAVERCMLRPYMHSVYSSQRFIEPLHDDPNRGAVNTERWRESIARYLLKESGLQVTWNPEPIKIEAVREEDDESSSNSWMMCDVDPFDDGRAEPLGMTGQSPLAMLTVFGVLRSTVWTGRLLKMDEADSL